MIIQVFGKKKCNETKKAERFFSERKIKIQIIDLLEKGFSKRELESVLNNYDIEELLDKDGKEYKKRNLKYMVYDTKELLMENPILFKTPIVRNKSKVTVGYSPEEWKKWLAEKE